MLAILERWWRVAGLAAIVAVAGYCLAVSADLVSGDLLGEALGPVALAPEPDESAGDAGPPSADAEFTLPIPTPLEDDRVVAAMGPLVPLSCRKSDYSNSNANADPEVPAAAAYAAAEAVTRERALAAPSAPPEAEVDALMQRHLFAAALSPVLALSAPEQGEQPTNVATAGAPAAAAACPALLQHTFNRLQTGEPQTLCQFRGKVLLIVNTASYCGNTPQYEGLEALYAKYKDKGLVVVGFPSNDFGNQEPGTNTEIAEFCRTTYGVKFPMFEKSGVKKGGANPLFVELIEKTGTAPHWNFHKYVVDRTGTRVVSFSDSVKPDAPALVDLIEKLLADKDPAAKG